MTLLDSSDVGEHQHKLDEGALGFFDAIVMAVAGSAPAYSIAATTAVIVSAVGFGAPAALLWCGIPMFGIAVAYHQLNKMGADAGAAFAWVGRVLHPFLGYLTGWALIMSSTIFMVAGSLPAGQVTLSLFSTHLASETGWVTAIGALMFLIMAACVARGVRITANAQWIMSSVEIVLLAVFVVLGLLHGHKEVSFSMSWLGFGHFGSFSGFIAGALIAAFYYWGWDVSSNLGEETENSATNSGMGGMIGVVIVFVLFMLFTIVINMDVSQKVIQSNSGNVLEAFGNTVWSGAGGKLMIVAVMLSTVATLETTLIQVTRSLFSMGRGKTLPVRFGRLHASWKTPAFATGVIVVIAMGMFVLSNFVGSINTVLTDAINAVGLQIAVYYGLAGYAAVVGFRKYALRSFSNFLFMFVFPLIGAGFMTWIFVESIPNASTVVVVFGLGGMALGLIPMLYYYRKGAPYLHEKPTLGSVPLGGEVAEIAQPN